MLKRYKTLYKEGNGELIEKKSKFLGLAKPVDRELDAQNYLEALRKKYWDANHIVFAYRIGQRNELQRYSDDGEPPGTGGLPLLDVLRGQDIENAIVAVIRYFGGTLLGKGGLARAYSHCASKAIEAALIIEKIPCQALRVITDYGSLGKIQYAAQQHNYTVRDMVYTDKVELLLILRLEESEIFQKELVNLTAGQVIIKESDAAYGTWMNDKQIE